MTRFQSKMRVIITRLYKYTPLSPNYLLLLLLLVLFHSSLFLYAVLLIPHRLSIWLFFFFICLCVHSLSASLPLHSLLLTLLPICLSSFCLYSWKETVRHTWERTNHMGSLRVLPQEKQIIFLKHIPPTHRIR